MPGLPNGPFGPIPSQVTLDASGNGTIIFQPNGKNARITNLFGKVSTQVKQALVSVYLGQIGDANRVFNNNSGSTGFNARGFIDVSDGQTLYVVWTGGDVGAIASATFSGTTVPFGDPGFGNGFSMDADDPIAAGDGSLIFPAIKSPNFVTGVSGWFLDRDGDIELNDAVIRGTVDIAGGVVTVNNMGIEVTGPTEKFTINVTGGIRARKIPDDGSFITVNSDGIFIHEKEPSPLLGLNSNSAVMQTDNINAGGSEWVRMRIYSPEWDTQLGTSSISLWSKSNGGGGTTIDLNANLVRHNAPIVEYDDEVLVRQTDGDPMFEQFLGNSVRATDIVMPNTSPGLVLFTFTGATWKANRAYRVSMRAKYIGTGGGQQPAIALRLGTTTAGTILVDNGRLDYTAASNNYKVWEAIFTVGNADVARDICVSGGSVIIGTSVTQVGSGDNPALLEVKEIGPSSRYAGFPDIT
jgi:hypothetical protein